MEKNTNTKPINRYFALFILLVILILAWIGSYWLKYHRWPWHDIKNAMENAQNANNVEQVIENHTINNGQKEEIFRQMKMNDLSQKIGQLSPVEAVLGGKWFVDRFWFADGGNVYIEYEDGHILRRILVKIEGTQEKPQYKIIGYFEPGENDWVLKQGDDTMFGKPLGLYEYNEIKGEWVKKN